MPNEHFLRGNFHLKKGNCPVKNVLKCYKNLNFIFLLTIQAYIIRNIHAKLVPLHPKLVCFDMPSCNLQTTI